MEMNDLIRKYRCIKPDKKWVEENRAHLLVYFQEEFSVPSQIRGRFFVFKPVFISLLVLVVVFLTSFGTLLAAENSLPGDRLYPVKRFAEKVKISLAFNREEKTVLRAEILNTRFKEAKILAEKINQEDGTKIAPKLVKMTKEMHQEIKNLKKEIAAQVTSPSTPIDITFDEGSLPIQDGREVVKIIQSPDLEKTLEQTKALLKEKDLVSALAKTNEVEKYLTKSDSATSSHSESETVVSEEKSLNQTELPRNQIPSLEKESLLKQVPLTDSFSQPVQQILEPNSDDFQIAPQREEPVKIEEPIKE